ncbi:hypothetical protein BKA67DRAFT_154832 [Truncatella angustata]|uniref:Uncharacterized protein n=1 Tax=Truncatella angustata TaxID=152316 RepID=A0A9P8UQE4_9PEZI|nr:uncharacterized protein BKA67DRAFT_154832 [Truncatella angustata]KAH6656411.1 hypothetical protein BKA67DRAFT_154832 [Truncatella angustata]KAH8194964.1 hypothetical protein TruAng_010866 [Truncatella angustata]
MSSSNASKRPRLSLQIQTGTAPRARTRSTLRPDTDPKSPTAFNTLSNVYVTAIERSTPAQSTPLTAINLFQTLKLQTNPEVLKDQQRTHTPYTALYPDTPLSANPRSPMQMEIQYPSTMTATPPLSAGPVEPSSARVFSFVTNEMPSQVVPASPVQSRRRMPAGPAPKPPYTHPRSLHSILRNSPLPPSSAMSPVSPRRQSLRLQEKAARRVGYESPLTQTIINERYTKSHVDLLAEEVTPNSATPAVEDSEMALDLTMAYTGDETRDGGQTPGPFEEMRRRMAGLASETPISSPRPGGIRKKRKEKKRKWVWTIGQEENEDESGALAAFRATAEASTPRIAIPFKATTPEPLTALHVSVEPTEPHADTQMDVEMSDTSSMFSSSRATTPFSVDLDMKTPTASAAYAAVAKAGRLGSMDLINPDTGSRRDTPIPPDLVMNN